MKRFLANSDIKNIMLSARKKFGKQHFLSLLFQVIAF